MTTLIAPLFNCDVIASNHSARIKAVKRLLTDKKERADSGKFVAEGIRWVEMLLQKNSEAVCALHIRQGSADKIFDALKLGDYLDRGVIDKQQLVLVKDDIFDKACDTQQPQGVLAVVDIARVSAGVGCVDNVLNAARRVLILDGIKDPGNLGTIIRTAAASGNTAIFLRNCVDVYNPKVVRSTMGALLDVNLFYNGGGCIDVLKNNGFFIIAAALSGKNINNVKHELFSIGKMAIIIGGEAYGVSKELLDEADLMVTIPMQNGVESLNAAVAAGVLMYSV